MNSDNLSHPSADPVERALADIQGAIRLVAARVATRVVLTALPGAEMAAGAALAAAQRAGVGFALQRDPDSGSIAVVVGPLTGR